MKTDMTLEYWVDDGWYVGRLKEVPGVFSQGESVDELQENIRDAYRLVLSESESGIELPSERLQRTIEV